MDFYTIERRNQKKGTTEIYPAFVIHRSDDLMVRARSFYAIWDEERKIWSTNEDDVARLIDQELNAYTAERADYISDRIVVRTMRNFETNSWKRFKEYMNNMYDNYEELDSVLTFSDTQVTKKDYVSKRLPYPLVEGDYSAWDELIGTLYNEEERRKIEWAIGAIISGEAKYIQKFIVLYGEAGAGKSTVLNILQKLFEGYYTTFEAKELTSSGNSFSTESFKGNPLVAIQHDGDLSRIEDNSKLNAIVSHEEMRMNEKYKPSYSSRVNCFLFMGTNKPVKITDGKSGLIRRLIDVHTSGQKVPVVRYQTLVSQIDLELGAIASHCLKVYRKYGKHYYSSYIPIDMMFKTDIFFNFVESYYYEFAKDEPVTLTRAYALYKTYCDESNIPHKLPKYKFRDELKNYFAEFLDRVRLNGETNPTRSVYKGFLKEKFLSTLEAVDESGETPQISLAMEANESIFDREAATYPAQYADAIDSLPKNRWENVKTTLNDLDTTKLHYVQVPNNHIVIDFDLKDESGEKSAELNLREASKWPPTYAEYSKSGKGIHLHYIYDAEVDRLERLYSKGIEIKVFNGNASLRRKLTKCNMTPIAHLNSGLPLKGETSMIDKKAVASEQGLRNLIIRNLKKEIHPGTKPSVDFIYKILEEAYESGLRYDITDLRPKILFFANSSTNQSEYCVELVAKMKFSSEDPADVEEEEPIYESEEYVFFDVESFPNLFIVCWKFKGPDQTITRMINPNSMEIESILGMKLIGFNNRRYDNHMLYAAYLGYTPEQLFEVSSKITSNSRNGYFREAYNLSYTDVYDFASAGNKKSLKKWEIELGINHKELGLPWDEPVPQDKWLEVAEYCDNDVDATEAVFDHLSGDWEARKVLAELSGLTVNHTTNQHTTRIVFGDVKDTQDDLVYTDLSTLFPGYKFELGKSTYRDVNVGEGGYVYAEPGIYENVALLDIASMHPTSIEQLNMFGKYTKRFSDLKRGRVMIKRDTRDGIEDLLDGKLVPFFERADAGQFSLKDLANGLKTAINSAYGLTNAHHDNPFKDKDNIDNIVAKRGALFMVELQYAVQEKGFTVAHIKTDSIKIPNATKEIIDFVFEFGKKYGYEFEHEATYSKLCLVNDAVYIAKYANGKHAGEWTATGAQFAHPIVFKSLFSKERPDFKDYCETKAVTGSSAIYLDLNEDLEEGEHNYQFVGRVGSFCPIVPGQGAGQLMRLKDDKYYAVSGTKGYRWLEAETAVVLRLTDKIDYSYSESLINAAKNNISKFGDFNDFVS